MRTLGKYEILDELGNGSMGVVYRAHDTVIDREIALKTIRTGIEAEPEMRERFYREARSCGRLQHPNIVTIYDLGEEAKTAYIAMELLEGFDFRKLIDQQRDLPLARKLEWVAQMCDALGHAHRHGVIHRDVKPSNLFLTKSGSVKVLDFGIARLTSSQLTVAGKILGTPNYMAPEQILGKPCDGRADLFSVGVVFFELLVYQHPFRGPMIPRRIVESEPDSLFDHQSNLPPVLEKVFARALAKKVEDRYPQASVFAADLRAILESLREHSPASGISLPELPSDRAEVATADFSFQGRVVEPAYAPIGEDSAEWRNSEVLMLIPQFEKAIEQNDYSEAKIFYQKLLRVTVADGRFAEAIASCKVRLDQIAPVVTEATVLAPLSLDAASGISRPTDAPVSHTQKICSECGAGNRGAARFCIGCGANFADPTPIPSNEPAPLARSFNTAVDQTVLYPSEQPISNTGSQAAPAPSRSSSPSQSLATVTSWARTHQRYVIAGSLALLLVLLISAAVMFRSPRVEPAIADSNVAASKMEVHAAANGRSKVIYDLKRGDSVKILGIPTSHSQEWIKVQSVVNGDAKPAGFARQEELTSLTARNSAVALALIRVKFQENTEVQGEKKLDALKALVAKYPGTNEAMSASAEIAELEKAPAPASPGPQSPVENGPDAASKLQEADAKWKEGNYSDAEGKVLELLTADPENAQAKQLLAEIQQSRRLRDLRRAEKLWKDGKYSDAERLLGGVLSQEPDNSKAKDLLQKIRKTRDLEK